MGGNGKVDWDSVEAWHKLVSAIIATGVKLDIRSVATHYGTTYHTLENKLRKIKKEAAVMKEEVASGARGEVAAPRSTTSTPKKPKAEKTAGTHEKVTNGRVSKISPTKSSPTKKGVAVKQEMFEGMGNDTLSDATVSFGGEAMGFGSQGLGEEVDLNLDLGMTGMGGSFE